MSKKILYIDHKYHCLTKSTQFLLDALKESFDITEIYLNPDETEKWLESVKGAYFDCVIIFQMSITPKMLEPYICFKKGIFIPMYDAQVSWDVATWDQYKDFTILNFSKTLHDKLVGLGYDSRYYQYFPKCPAFDSFGDERSAFFWQRITDININTVRSVLQDQVDSLNLHKKIDPGHSVVPLNRAWKDVHISETTWFEKKSELDAVIQKSAIYFAPRLYEGIGMSFLEAMAIGRCVIATDTPTMNEYIEHGVNGFLYDLHHPQKVQISNIRQVQNEAVRFIREGRLEFEKKFPNIVRDVSGDRLSILCDVRDVLANDALKWSFVQEVLQTDSFSVRLVALVEQKELLRKLLTRDVDVIYLNDHDVIEFKNVDVVITKRLNSSNNGVCVVNFEQCSSVNQFIEQQRKMKQNNPVVTVVTIVKNLIKAKRESTVLQCINSVAQQKYCGEIEHLIVDGQSDDGTLELLAEYETAGLVKVVSRADSGIYDAMNNGFKMASGKYVVFLNSDDYFARTDAVAESVKALENSEAAFSFGNFRTVELNGKVKGRRTHELGLFFLRMPFSHQTLFVRKDVAASLGFFNADKFKSAGDYDFVLRLILSGAKGVYVDKDLIHFRLAGFSSNTELSERECLQLLFEAYSKLTHITKDEVKKLFYESCFSKELFFKLKRVVDSSVLVFMNHACDGFKDEDKFFKYVGWNTSTYFNEISEGYESPSELSSVVLKHTCYKVLKTLTWGKARNRYKEKYQREKNRLKVFNRRKVRILGVPLLTIYSNNQTKLCVVLGFPFYSVK